MGSPAATPRDHLKISAVTRRCVVASLLTGYTASLIPWALAQSADGPDQGAFMAVSAIIAGRQSLDAGQAKRLYDALSADDKNFPAMVRELLTLINQRRIDPLQLQKILDSEKSPFAGVPRKIAAAWFLGIVGEGAKARCLAYEKALNAIIVSDVLKPPTYAYGVYGSWTAKPI